ncbi:MAG TPA: YihY/virulence factor BrkB family protein [Propionibacteriaceae bacterium]|jgi:membrane protein|nr:YihY/virulence factor BrkB family protein [Propionibacteriaceae bacterium]
MIITTTQEQVQVPGGKAERRTEIPARGWIQVVKRGAKEAKADQVPLLAAGVAFYAFMAIFPALIAVVSIYGLFADPSTIANQLNSLTGTLPDEARKIIIDQVTALSTRRQTLGISLVLSLLIALWSASAGTSNLLTAINVAYNEEEKRGFVKKRLLALGLTVAAIIFMVIILGLVAVSPPLLKVVFGTGALRWVLQIVGWLIVLVLVPAALALLYRLAPDRDAPRMKWASVGAVVATLIWLAASIGFSIYTSTFGNYAKTYGVFAGIVVLLLWLWLTMYAILLGAEINAEAEQQTIADTTKGEEKPLGERRAVKADSNPVPQSGHRQHD